MEPLSPPIGHSAGLVPPIGQSIANFANPLRDSTTAPSATAAAAALTPARARAALTASAQLGHTTSAAAKAASAPPGGHPPLHQKAELQNLPLASRFRAGPALQVRWVGSEPTSPPTDSTGSVPTGN